MEVLLNGEDNLQEPTLRHGKYVCTLVLIMSNPVSSSENRRGGEEERVESERRRETETRTASERRQYEKITMWK